MGGAPSNISFQGFHARPGGFPLIVIDEAMGVDPTVFTAIDGITGWTQEWNSSNAVFLVAGHLSLHGTLTLEVHQNSGGRSAERVHGRDVDAIVVYDIQDESGRTQVDRPFPFIETVDPRQFGALLRHLTGKPSITYKSLGNLDELAWRAWLDESAKDPGFRALSIVGRPTSGVTYELSLAKAIRLAAAHPSHIVVGGVAIAERHTDKRSEAARLLSKTIDGCSYFISQTVYSAEPTREMLTDYVRECHRASVEPRRIVLTFAPCGRERTMRFLRWLGVNVPPEVARSILTADAPATGNKVNSNLQGQSPSDS